MNVPSHVTHSTRKPIYPKTTPPHLNRILKIDEDKKVVYVEPNVPMDVLLHALLEKGLLLPVVPEFKGITVGGAIGGSALESSSHRYGQFNDTCIAYQILLENGEIVRATKENYADLFYGIAGAYGSIGTIILAEIGLIKAKPWVHLTIHRLTTVDAGIELISQLHQKADFIEGFVFDEDQISVVEGHLITEEAGQSLATMKLSPWSAWYYQQIKNTTLLSQKMTLSEYLFRHDRGAFWMGSYGQHYSLFLRYYLENKWKILSQTDLKKYAKLKKQSLFFSLFFGSWMTSRKLYRMVHSQSEEWFAKHFVVQDYYIPLRQAVKFINFINHKAGIYPLWLCPIKSTQTPQIFSPHQNQEKLLIDVGVYGISAKESAINAQLEQHAVELKGRKMLYSANDYTEQVFWKIYSKTIYEQLRQKYHARKRLSIERKVLKKSHLC